MYSLRLAPQCFTFTSSNTQCNTKLEVPYISTDLWTKKYCTVALTMPKHNCVVYIALVKLMTEHVLVLSCLFVSISMFRVILIFITTYDR